jgi:hypothetical protein
VLIGSYSQAEVRRTVPFWLRDLGRRVIPPPLFFHPSPLTGVDIAFVCRHAALLCVKESTRKLPCFKVGVRAVPGVLDSETFISYEQRRVAEKP